RHDRSTPVLDSLRPLHEAIAARRCDLSLSVHIRPGVIAEHLEPVPVKHRNPAFDRYLPDRMPPEIGGHNADTHRLRWDRRAGKRRRAVTRSHGTAHERTIARVQVTIVATLIDKVERQVGAGSLGKFIEAGASGRIAEAVHMLLVRLPPRFDLGLVL